MVNPSSLESLMSTLGVSPLPGGGYNSAAVSPTTWQQFQQTWVNPAPAFQVPPIYVHDYEEKPVVFNSKHLQLLNAYRHTICHLQYHIAHTADPSLGDELFNLAMASESALLGTLTLTALFKTRMRGLRMDEASIDDGVTDTLTFKSQLGQTLAKKRMNPASVDEGDAMGSLHMLSAVLFDGGTDAEWDKYLDMAKLWVEKQPVVKKGSWTPADDIAGLIGPDGKVDKKQAFIMKATFWFDILGAVTMRREPRFLNAYEELFGRNGGSGMERIMGCDEKVLLAIAETASLARWRKDMEDQGCLSVMELAQRAKKIEEKLTFVGPVYWGTGTTEDLFNGTKGTSVSSTGPEISLEDLLSGRNTSGALGTSTSTSSGSAESEATNNDFSFWAKHKLRLISNVFRATGRLYLHTVVSQCNPDVKEIKNGVTETIQAFRNLQMSDVDRSLVFPIALAGCLTDDRSYREYLVSRLKALGKEGEAVGNSRSCLLLMEKVWEKRDSGSNRIVDWIDTMKEMGWSLLLV
ncbi:hypothetical protein FRC02_004693 [Tulasnella sp. 418]|nr:hypothetical protein FRC02_004693 [Tulasnella sp. 418]